MQKEEALMHLMCGFVLFYIHLFLVGLKFREPSENVCKVRYQEKQEFQIEKESDHHLLNLSQKFMVQESTITNIKNQEILQCLSDHRSLRCKQVGAIESKSFKGNLITFSIEESLSEEIVLMRYILIFKKPCPLREFYIKINFNQFEYKPC